MHSAVEAHLDALFQRYTILESIRASLITTFKISATAFRDGKRLFVCGNGGSAADSEHIVGELAKGFLCARRLSEDDASRFVCACRSPEEGRYLVEHLQYGLPAVSLTGHPSLATAVTNDTAGDMVFAQQLFALGTEGDVLIGISTSGNARNVYLAAVVAKGLGMSAVGLTGRRGGRLAEVTDVCVCVPETETFLVQEMHLPVYHALCAMLEAEFFATSEVALGRLEEGQEPVSGNPS